jgi:hypothetical protein
VTGAHQIAAQILAGADQIAQALGLHRGHRDPTKLTGHQQPHQPLGVTLIGLDAIRRSARNQARRTHQTIHPRRL